MIKEYKTISEVVGPLMLVKNVENVTYDELGEIQLPNGEKRLCKVLEVNGSDAMVQLFESSTGINLKESTVKFLGRGTELAVSPDILGRVFDGMGRPKDGGEQATIIQRKAIERRKHQWRDLYGQRHYRRVGEYANRCSGTTETV